MQVHLRGIHLFAALVLLIASGALAAESPYLYGIHDTAPAPTEWLNHVKQGSVTGGWLTSTVAVGCNPNDHGGVDFTSYANQGHTVVCRINNGYSDVGTIPLPEHYDEFAQRCANFVQNSPGCEIWVIGNETNLCVEWPPLGSNKPYVSPQDYANCFRQVYNAIKAVRPNHKVVSQALGPFGGPYGPGTFDRWTHDGCPLSWVDYMNQMLTAIKNSGGIDGIALHINSRGYAQSDIHSTAKVYVGKDLYWSFYVYKDWINYGIPSDLYHLPLYATECNGIYYWKGGHPERPDSHYEPGWMQEIYAEINRWNQSAASTGKPIFRCVNMYRWCDGCDGWNIDGSSNPYKAQILSDLDAAVAHAYRWPEPPQPPGAVSGYVRDRNGSAMSNTRVATSDGAHSTTTNSSGYYTLTDVPAGACELTAIRTAYCTQTVSVSIVSAGTVTQNFTITRIGDNLLTNGNFEGGFQASGVATGWKSWTSGWSNPITFADSTSPVHAGSHAQRWGRADRLRVHGGICQAAGGSTPGRQYVVDGWIRFQTTDPGAWAEVGYDLTGQTSNAEAATVQYTKLESGGQNAWLNFNRTVTATGNGISIFFKFGQYNEGGAGPSWAYADDVTIYEVQTPPLMQFVTDDGACQTNRESIHASWAASDSESGITGYQYAVSTTPNETGIIAGGGWASVGLATQATRNWLALSPDQTYYVLVKARNAHNQWSTPMASDGITIASGPFTLATAKQQPDGRWVEITNLVCAHAPVSDIMPVRELGNTIGIKVTKGAGVLPSEIVPGAKLTITGRLTTNADTRELTDVSVTDAGSTEAPGALMFIGRNIGGGNYFYNPGPPAQGQKGTPWGIGTNNVGLMVTVIGHVSAHGTGKFFVRDGSSIPGDLPVTCLSGVTRPDIGRLVKVTGLVEASGLLVLGQRDVVVLQ